MRSGRIDSRYSLETLVKSGHMPWPSAPSPDGAAATPPVAGARVENLARLSRASAKEATAAAAMHKSLANVER